MLFHSFEFVVVFLPAVIVAFYALRRFAPTPAVIGLLVVASLFYYGWWNPRYLLLILGSIAGNYAFGQVLEKFCRQGRIARGRWALGLGVAANLGVLGYFKYANFFIANINWAAGAALPSVDIVLPLAISFFTFQQIAYLVDVHQGLAEEHDILQYALFVSFFPQLIAGPIVHHGEMMPQFRKPESFRFHAESFAEGAAIFFLGMFKKVALADNLAPYADQVFGAAQAGNEITLFAAWGGALSYTFQLYFDFSAYSDMAIGLALMFGIRLPRNFAAPYQATSIIDFWKRWHMTLSRFLKAYVYIPLGGNRRGVGRRHLNILATMLLGGLWHGASWTFVAWGAVHGIFLVVNHAWRRFVPGNAALAESRLWRLAAWVLTFAAVVASWVLFRAESFAAAVLVLKGMAGASGALLPIQVVQALPWLGHFVSGAALVPYLAGGTVIGLLQMGAFLLLSFAIVGFGRPLDEMSQPRRLVLLVVTFAYSMQVVLFGGKSHEFIYFQF